jgi:carotenoid cleavage dioxygenase
VKSGEASPASIGCFDFETGEKVMWSPGPASGVQEPNFAPLPGGKGGEAEGYLLTIVNRFEEGHSDLAILRANDVGAGPVCLLKMPVRVRATFHGMWVPEEVVQTGRYSG